MYIYSEISDLQSPTTFIDTEKRLLY